jgi:hypothetical protein
MDPGLAALLGAAIGGLIAWAVSAFQRRHDRRERREERRFERLALATLHLRLSLGHAMKLDYSKSYRAILLDPAIWGPRWQPFLESVSSAGAAMALVVDEVPKDLWDEYLAAAAALVEATKSDHDLLNAYMVAAKALSSKVEERARELTRLTKGKQSQRRCPVHLRSIVHKPVLKGRTADTLPPP